MADIEITNHGSIVTFLPLSDAATEWITENVQSDAQWFGGALCVEPRYAGELAAGMQDAGLVCGVV